LFSWNFWIWMVVTWTSCLVWHIAINGLEFKVFTLPPRWNLVIFTQDVLTESV
jgi:hypothetical protein